MFSRQELQQFLLNHLEPCNYIGFEILYFPIPCKELYGTFGRMYSPLKA